MTELKKMLIEEYRFMKGCSEKCKYGYTEDFIDFIIRHEKFKIKLKESDNGQSKVIKDNL